MKTLSSRLERTPGAHGLLPAVLVTGCLAWGALLTSAFGDDSGGDSGGDPTVGTLPITGNSGQALDQTLTLRGNVEDLDAAIQDADGRGHVDIIPLQGGMALMRFYGDVRIELDLGALANIEVGIWAGFEGGGMAYAIETPGGLGTPHLVASGYDVVLDPIRYANVGLLEEPLLIHAFHRIGQRTKTTLEMRPSAGTVVIFQDV